MIIMFMYSGAGRGGGGGGERKRGTEPANKCMFYFVTSEKKSCNIATWTGRTI